MLPSHLIKPWQSDEQEMSFLWAGEGLFSGTSTNTDRPLISPQHPRNSGKTPSHAILLTKNRLVADAIQLFRLAVPPQTGSRSLGRTPPGNNPAHDIGITILPQPHHLTFLRLNKQATFHLDVVSHTYTDTGALAPPGESGPGTGLTIGAEQSSIAHF